MIKENIQININDKSFDAEIIVPSQVMTSTPQEENVDLTKTPNFILKVEDEDKTINVTDIVEVSFTLGEYDYTANMKAYNRGGGIIALQYDSNLTAEESSDSSDSSDSSEPEEVLPLDITFLGGDEQQIDPMTEMLNDNFTVIDPNVIDPETGTGTDVTLQCEYSGVRDGSEPMTNVELDAGTVNITVPGIYTITATEPTTGHTGEVTLVVTAAPGALILNAEKYYTAYDISENENPQKSEAITATFNDVAIDARSMTFDGLVYNDVDVRSGNRVKFVPNDVQIDGNPGVYTDDVTAEYQYAQTSCQVIAVAVDTAAQTGLTVDKPYYACSVNQNTSEQTNAHARILYNGTELDPTDVQMSGTYYNQYWVWNVGSGDFMADGMKTFSGYDVVTITYNNESISCLLKIDVTGLEM